MAALQLSREEARRIAVQAQLLDAPRPTDLHAVIRHLTLLQIDPTAAVAPNAHLVAWSRLGSAYQPDSLRQALEEDRTLFEFDAMIRPIEDLPLYYGHSSAAWTRYEWVMKWMTANDRFRRDILARLRDAGPLVSRDIPDTAQVPWKSTGWTHNRNVTQMLEFMLMLGDVAISRRQGSERVWDLAERVYPAGLPTVSDEEAFRIRGERRLKSLGIARVKGPQMPLEPTNVGSVGEEAVVEGVKGTWRVDPEAVDRVRTQPVSGRTALLSPFDRLTYDRKRSLELFDFEYILEMYKPVEKRRWGFFALPILHEEQVIGKADLTADRKAGVLRVNAIHQDVKHTKAMTDGIKAEIADLASWLQLSIFRTGR
ncbi:MAG: winged helix-turn-helix domain-containing protein [Chloroflexi bacterium]|nr:MAG: winged helix-turn-helix domain-containing protein [Chloroflexota bacterium]